MASIFDYIWALSEVHDHVFKFIPKNCPSCNSDQLMYAGHMILPQGSWVRYRCRKCKRDHTNSVDQFDHERKIHSTENPEETPPNVLGQVD
jgi:transposase-like protein